MVLLGYNWLGGLVGATWPPRGEWRRRPWGPGWAPQPLISRVRPSINRVINRLMLFIYRLKPIVGYETTQTGYGTSSVGCRGGSRYVEGCWGFPDLEIKKFKVSWFQSFLAFGFLVSWFQRTFCVFTEYLLRIATCQIHVS